MSAIDPVSYIKGLSMSERDELAQRIGSTLGHLCNIAYGDRQLSPLYAARLERVTGGLVPRHLSRPDDWREIWPELAPADPAVAGVSA